MTDFNDSRRRQALIGRGLRQMYGSVLNEDLPESYIELLGEFGLRKELELQEQQKRQEAEPVSKAEAEKLAKDYRSSRRRQDPIGRRLQEAYNNVLKEDVPEEFIRLLCEYGLKREDIAPDQDTEAVRRRKAFEKRVDDLFDEVTRPEKDSES